MRKRNNQDDYYVLALEAVVPTSGIPVRLISEVQPPDEGDRLCLRQRASIDIKSSQVSHYSEFFSRCKRGVAMVRVILLVLLNLPGNVLPERAKVNCLLYLANEVRGKYERNHGYIRVVFGAVCSIFQSAPSRQSGPSSHRH